jgi:hypothetical protein
MRIFLPLLTVLLTSGILQAQQVQKCCGTTNSSFLLGSMNFARHNQSIYLPSDFQNAAPGNITRIYYRYGTSNFALGNTLTDLTISMLQTQQTHHVNNLFITGTTPVFTKEVYVIAPGVANTWFAIDLDVPFLYDPTLPLVVDIRFDQSDRNMTCRATPTPGRKLATGDPDSPTGSTTSTNLHDIGFDLDTPTGVPTEGPMITLLHPNPATDQVHMVFGEALKGAHTVWVLDAAGRVILQDPVAAGLERVSMDVSGLAPGMYVMRVSGPDGGAAAMRFSRE